MHKGRQLPYFKSFKVISLFDNKLKTIFIRQLMCAGLLGRYYGIDPNNYVDPFRETLYSPICTKARVFNLQLAACRAIASSLWDSPWFGKFGSRRTIAINTVSHHPLPAPPHNFPSPVTRLKLDHAPFFLHGQARDGPYPVIPVQVDPSSPPRCKAGS